MLGKTKAFSGFSVDDIEKARQFYGDTLGIDTSEQYGLLTLHLAGGRDTLVYPKPDHTPAAYTILNFEVDDIDQAVDGLASRGVQFERYDGLGQDERGSTARAARISPGSRTPLATSCPSCSRVNAGAAAAPPVRPAPNAGSSGAQLSGDTERVGRRYR